MHAAARALTDQSTPAVRQPYLTSGTLGLVHRRRGIRWYIRQEEQEYSRRWRLIIFAAFVLHANGQVFTDAAQLAAARWLVDLDHSIAAAVELLRETTTAVRAAVQRDRVAYLSGLADAVTQQDLRAPKELYAAVRKAYPAARAARRQNFQPLPAVRLADGRLARTNAEKTQRWVDFFSEQEAGTVVDSAGYIDAFQCPAVAVGSEKAVFSVRALPTLQQLEQ